MTEKEILDLWAKNRLHIIVSQFAPTFLLITTVWLMTTGLTEGPELVRYTALGILLASGILGALVQYNAATEAMALADDLSGMSTSSRVSARIIASKPWLNVVRYLTPAIFVVIFILIALALLG